MNFCVDVRNLGLGSSNIGGIANDGNVLLASAHSWSSSEKPVANCRREEATLELNLNPILPPASAEKIPPGMMTHVELDIVLLSETFGWASKGFEGSFRKVFVR